MRYKFKKIYFIGIFFAVIIFLLDAYLYLSGYKRWLLPLIIVAINVGWLQFWLDFYKEIKIQKEIEIKFLEFVRNISEITKSGVSIPKAIVQLSAKDYGALNHYLRKLAHQIEWGIVLHKGLITFAKDTGNPVIARAVSIMIEADASGGNIEEVLEKIVDSVVQVKKMKEEQKSSTYSQIVQGYIVYFIFIGIMLMMQLWLFPQITDIGSGIQTGLSFITKTTAAGESGQFDLDKTFFYLIIMQGFFAGIMIGKFSEGSIKTGLIHSLILITLSTLVITTVKGGI